MIYWYDLQVNSSGLTMICTKRAVGHTKAVLSVCATEQLMISGSKGLSLCLSACISPSSVTHLCVVLDCLIWHFSHFGSRSTVLPLYITDPPSAQYLCLLMICPPRYVNLTQSSLVLFMVTLSWKLSYLPVIIADLTCKVWDLSIGAELMSLGDHPNYVTTVRYCDVNKLVYTVSNSFVKIWDIRSGAKCVKVLRLDILLTINGIISHCKQVIYNYVNYHHNILSGILMFLSHISIIISAITTKWDSF